MAVAAQLEASKRQRQHCMILSTIMGLMDTLTNPALQPSHRAFLERQLAHYKEKCAVMQSPEGG